MKQSTMLSLEKFMRAKKMEHEALIGLFPDQMQKHLKVINKEVTELVMETALSIAETILDTKESDGGQGDCSNQGDDRKASNPSEHSQEDSGVRKVHIG